MPKKAVTTRKRRAASKKRRLRVNGVSPGKRLLRPGSVERRAPEQTSAIRCRPHDLVRTGSQPWSGLPPRLALRRRHVSRRRTGGSRTERWRQVMV